MDYFKPKNTINIDWEHENSNSIIQLKVLLKETRKYLRIYILKFSKENVKAFQKTDTQLEPCQQND